MFVIFCSRPPENVKRGSFMSKPRNDDKEIYKQACCCCCFANLIFFGRSRYRRRRDCFSSLLLVVSRLKPNRRGQATKAKKSR